MINKHCFVCVCSSAQAQAQAYVTSIMVAAVTCVYSVQHQQMATAVLVPMSSSWETMRKTANVGHYGVIMHDVHILIK